MSDIDYDLILIDYYKKLYKIKKEFPLSNILFHFQRSSLPVIHFIIVNRNNNNIRDRNEMYQMYNIDIEITDKWVKCIEITGNSFNSLKTIYMFQNILINDDYSEECIKIIRKCKLYLNYLANIRKN